MEINKISEAISELKHSMFIKLKGLKSIELEQITDRKFVSEQVITDDICLPPYEGYWKHDDFNPLMRLIDFYRPKRLLELGTAHGNTVANICNEFPDISIITVDVLGQFQSGELTTYQLNKDDIGRVYRNYNFSDRVLQIYENTLNLDLAKYDIPKSSIDFAIIDACHDTDYVINDFYKVKPFMKPDGIILFHDTSPVFKAHLEHSYLACMNLVKKGFPIYHIKNTWWGIYGC